LKAQLVVPVFSVIAGIVPTIGYVLLVWLVDRYEKEPARLLVVTFVWGAIPAVILSLIFETILHIPLDALGVATDFVSSSIIAPLVEETVKALALWGLYLFIKAEFDDVLDGLVYGALIGLGFGMTENVAYFLHSYGEGGWLQWLVTVAVRSLLFGLTHAFYTGIVGAALGYARLARDKWKRRWVPVAGLAAAMIFHAIHNATASAFIFVCPGILFAVASDWAGVLLLLVIILLAWQKEKSWIVNEMREEVALGIISAEDYATISSPRPRATAYWRYWQEQGWQQARHWRQLTQRAVELAFKKHQVRVTGRESPRGLGVMELRQHILALRAEMGQQSAGATVCVHCGQPLRAGSNFCTKCGQPIRGGASARRSPGQEDLS